MCRELPDSFFETCSGFRLYTYLTSVAAKLVLVDVFLSVMQNETVVGFTVNVCHIV